MKISLPFRCLAARSKRIFCEICMKNNKKNNNIEWTTLTDKIYSHYRYTYYLYYNQNTQPPPPDCRLVDLFNFNISGDFSLIKLYTLPLCV